MSLNSNGNFTQPPVLPPNARIEAIFLVLNKTEPSKRREPSAKIAGKGKILGDIVAPVIPADDWDALK